MSSLVSIDEEEGVTREDEGGATRTVRDLGALTVSGNQETVHITWTTYAWQPLTTLMAWVSKSAFRTCRRNKKLYNGINTNKVTTCWGLFFLGSRVVDVSHC